MSAPAVASRDQLNARLDEALAVYPLPPIVRRRLDDQWMHQQEPMIRSQLPPLAHLLVADVGAVHAWATHLSLTIRIDVHQAETGNVWRWTRARGYWLGWAISIGVDPHVSRPAELVDVSRMPALVRQTATLGTVW